MIKTLGGVFENTAEFFLGVAQGPFDRQFFGYILPDANHPCDIAVLAEMRTRIPLQQAFFTVTPFKRKHFILDDFARQQPAHRHAHARPVFLHQQEIKKVLTRSFHPGIAKGPFAFPVVFQNATFGIKEHDHAACGLHQRPVAFLTAAQVIFGLPVFGNVSDGHAIAQQPATFTANFRGIKTYPDLTAVCAAHFDIARMNANARRQIAAQLHPVAVVGIKCFGAAQIGLNDFAHRIKIKQCCGFFVYAGNRPVGIKINNAVNSMFKRTAITFFTRAFLPE